MTELYYEYPDVTFLKTGDGKMKLDDFSIAFEKAIPKFENRTMILSDWPESSFDLYMYKLMRKKNTYMVRYNEVLHKLLAEEDNVVRMLANSMIHTKLR